MAVVNNKTIIPLFCLKNLDTNKITTIIINSKERLRIIVNLMNGKGKKRKHLKHVKIHESSVINTMLK